MRGALRLVVSGVVFAVLLGLFGCVGFGPANDGPAMRRAIWMNRFDFRSESDVRDALREVGRAGFDTLFLQVRGNGTMLIPSRLEPWAREFGYRDPGFDPLAVAIDEGHRRGVRVHAWINVLPGWRGATPPPREIQQLYHERPEWFLVDQFGEREPLQANRYVLLNPCLPEVRSHLRELCVDIARRYDVAGIHLDYVRFLEPSFVERDGRRVQRDYPRDARTTLRFTDETGLQPGENPERWRHWKEKQIGLLVSQIREGLRATRPGLQLTAAVFAPPRVARQKVLQDWGTWLRNGWLDAVVPMNYRDDDAQFREDARACLLEAAHRHVVMGIGVYKHQDPEQTLRQIRIAKELGSNGIALYAYASFFPSLAAPPEGEAPGLARRRRDRIFPLSTGSPRR